MSETRTYVNATANDEVELKGTVYANRNLTASVSVGLKGDNGGYYIPIVDNEGNLSWTATDSSMVIPPTANIKGKQGERGEQGVQGEPGAQGERGEKGDKGDQGEQGVSISHVWNSTTLTVTSASGTSSANLKGSKGDKGDVGPQGIQGVQGEKGDRGEQGVQGPQGLQGIQGVRGEQGPKGDKGNDGVSVTHSWNGTTLTITSASGTSSANLKGDKGDKGADADLTDVNKRIGDLTNSYNQTKTQTEYLYNLNQGFPAEGFTDTTEAYSKAIPSGAKCFDLKMLGGKSVVVNQLAKNGNFANINNWLYDNVFNFVANGNKGVLTIPANYNNTMQFYQRISADVSHKYYITLTVTSTVSIPSLVMRFGATTGSPYAPIVANEPIKIQGIKQADAVNSEFNVYIFKSNVPQETFTLTLQNSQCIDLTKMFGAGNEPTLEQCQQIFSADYYPYNEGEIVSQQVENVVVRGANIWDEQIIPIPASAKLEGYGWSAGTVSNYIDFARKKFVKCVDRVRIGDLTWKYNSSNLGMIYCQNINPLVKPCGYRKMGNLLCDKFITHTQDEAATIAGMYRHSGAIDIVINGSGITNPATFKETYADTYIYYEMAEPQEFDIDIDDRFSAISCEGNGSITFEGSTDYQLSVPNEEEYFTKPSMCTPTISVGKIRPNTTIWLKTI